MIDLLLQNSLLLLFVVAALGYFIGRIKIRGFSLGVSAVLFVGLFFGALHLAYGIYLHFTERAPNAL